jgi:quercetin dioxygenase-like cupin family protein
MPGQKIKKAVIAGEAKYLRLLAGVPETEGMKSGYVVLQPGESVGSHSTGAKEEAIIILEGAVQVFAEGKPVLTGEKDSLVYVPPQTEHDMKNIGAGAARYVYVVSPVSAEGTC